MDSKRKTDKRKSAFTKGKRALSAFCATLMIGMAFPVVAMAETPEEKYNRLKAELDAISVQIENSRNDKAAAERLRAALEQEQEKISELIVINKQEIENAEKELEIKQATLLEKQAEVSSTEELFEQRVVAIYQMNNASVLTSILSVDSFTEFLQMIDAMTVISRNDTHLLESLGEQKQVLEKEQQEVDEILETLNVTYSELSGNADALAANIVAQDQQISKTEAELLANETAYGYTEEEAQQAYDEMLALTALINNTGSSAGESIPGMEPAPAPAPAPAPEPVPEPQPPAEGEPTDENQGEPVEGEGGEEVPVQEPEPQPEPQPEPEPEPQPPVIGSVHTWPVPASRSISCYFGAADPNGNRHLGLDIRAGSGSPIAAAGNGTVTIATWHNSYGNYIVVDHGDGRKTLYAHCSALYKSVGSYVNAGETIAAVGSTGFSTGPHLHFEVHENGVRQNPLNYVG